MMEYTVSPKNTDHPPLTKKLFEDYGAELIEALINTPHAFCQPGGWFIDIHKSVDHDLALLEQIWEEQVVTDGEEE